MVARPSVKKIGLRSTRRDVIAPYRNTIDILLLVCVSSVTEDVGVSGSMSMCVLQVVRRQGGLEIEMREECGMDWGWHCALAFRLGKAKNCSGFVEAEVESRGEYLSSEEETNCAGNRARVGNWNEALR